MLIFGKLLFPKEAADSVHHINYELLWDKGFRGLIFDIDNTLATYDVPRPPNEVAKLLNRLTNQGFRICLLSNNKKSRVVGFSGGLSCGHIWKARKPALAGVRRALLYLELPPKKVALIGDQIFTDTLCGNRAGLHTILTKPISTKDEWTVRLKRFPEKLILRSYYKSITMEEENAGQKQKFQ